ncbi:hypothetical protein [Pedobacter ginsengisoli]|uniref:hypothetical protein n=1 Tax=Pedobacter ginsengisoli TaxID=363852 RepID=UPI00254DAD64|nr:hypothetical protein [Pedobacter ginsengisoli]
MKNKVVRLIKGTVYPLFSELLLILRLKYYGLLTNMVKLFDLRPEIRYFRETTKMSVFGNKFALTGKKTLKNLGMFTDISIFTNNCREIFKKYSIFDEILNK